MDRQTYTIFRLLKAAAAPEAVTPPDITPSGPPPEGVKYDPEKDQSILPDKGIDFYDTDSAIPDKFNLSSLLGYDFNAADSGSKPAGNSVASSSSYDDSFDVGPIDITPPSADDYDKYSYSVYNTGSRPTEYDNSYNLASRGDDAKIYGYNQQAEPQPQKPRDPYFDTWEKEPPHDNTEEFNRDLEEWENRPDVGYMSQDEYDLEVGRLNSIIYDLSNDEYLKYKPEFDARFAELNRARYGDPLKQGKKPKNDPAKMLKDYDDNSPFVQHRNQIFGPDSPRGPGQRVEVGTLPEGVNADRVQQEPPPMDPEYQQKLDAIDNNPDLTPGEREWYRNQVLEANKEDYAKSRNNGISANDATSNGIGQYNVPPKDNGVISDDIRQYTLPPKDSDFTYPYTPTFGELNNDFARDFGRALPYPNATRGNGEPYEIGNGGGYYDDMSSFKKESPEETIQAMEDRIAELEDPNYEVDDTLGTALGRKMRSLELSALRSALATMEQKGINQDGDGVYRADGTVNLADSDAAAARSAQAPGADKGSDNKWVYDGLDYSDPVAVNNQANKLKEQFDAGTLSPEEYDRKMTALTQGSNAAIYGTLYGDQYSGPGYSQDASGRIIKRVDNKDGGYTMETVMDPEWFGLKTVNGREYFDGKPLTPREKATLNSPLGNGEDRLRRRRELDAQARYARELGTRGPNGSYNVTISNGGIR